MKIEKFNQPLLRVDTDITDEQYKILFLNVLAFRKAGGVISWDEWQTMDKSTIKAFIEANDVIQNEVAVASALANQGPLERKALQEGWTQEEYDEEKALDKFVENQNERKDTLIND